MKKYKLKLHYTADELKELRRLGEDYSSLMKAIYRIVAVGIGNNGGPLRKLGEKYIAIRQKDEFDFVADINNVVMGTAIFPEKKYVVHDKVAGQYIYYSVKRIGLFWGQLGAVIPEKKTKEEWLSINPAYEAMLEKVEN